MSVKKLFTIFVLLAFLVGSVFSLSAYAANKDMWAYVYRWKGGIDGDGTLKLERIRESIQFRVLQRNSDSQETLLEYLTTTSMSNPVDRDRYSSRAYMKADDVLSFRADPTESGDRYVDLIVTDSSGGFTRFYEDFDESTHTIVIDERPNVTHWGTTWFGGSTHWNTTLDTLRVDTDVDFLYDTLIEDVRVEVLVASSGDTIHVGLGGGTSGRQDDGLRKNVLLTTPGYPTDTGKVSEGGTCTYWPASTYGTLLYESVVGTGVSINEFGGRDYLGWIVTAASANGLTYSLGTPVVGEGYLHYKFIRIR